MSLPRLSRRTTTLAALAALLVGIVGVAAATLRGGDQTHLTLYFAEAKALYPGNAVQLRGVRVGTVTGVHPEAGRVRVTVSFDGSYAVPAGAHAAIISPSLVSVRAVTFAPIYTGGPALKDGDSIGLDRTVVPVEFDDVKKQLTALSDALGPNGANRDGALSGLITSTATTLGNGTAADVHSTIHQLSEAIQTLSDGRTDLFATVRNLQVFVSALRAGDATVRTFSTQLAGASDVLAADRQQLAAALTSLDGAFAQLTPFLQANRADLLSTTTALRSVTDLLAQQRQNIADILQFAPTTLSNFYNILDGDFGAMTGSIALVNLQSPATFICSTIFSLGGGSPQCQDALAPVAKLLALQPPGIGIGGGDGTPVGAGTTSGAPAQPGGAAPGNPAGGPDLTALLRAPATSVVAPAHSLLDLLLPGAAR